MEKQKLTDKQQRFIDEYLVDLNATKAAIRAGYSEKTAGWIGPRLVTKSHIQEAIQKGRAALSKRTGITQERVLAEYAKLAFFDPRKLFDDDGRPLPIKNLDDDTAAAVAGLEVCIKGNGEMGIGEVQKVKVADKKGALDSIARHLGMFNDKLDVKVTDALADRLARARKRAAGE